MFFLFSALALLKSFSLSFFLLVVIAFLLCVSSAMLAPFWSFWLPQNSVTFDLASLSFLSCLFLCSCDMSPSFGFVRTARQYIYMRTGSLVLPFEWPARMCQ